MRKIHPFIGVMSSMAMFWQCALITLSMTLSSCASDPQANRTNAALGESNVSWNDIQQFEQSWNIPKPKVKSFTILPSQSALEASSPTAYGHDFSDTVFTADSNADAWILNGLLPLHIGLVGNEASSEYCLGGTCRNLMSYLYPNPLDCEKVSLSYINPTASFPNNLDFKIYCFAPHKYHWPSVPVKGFFDTVTFKESSGQLLASSRIFWSPFYHVDYDVDTNSWVESGATTSPLYATSDLAFDATIGWFIPRNARVVDYQLIDDSESYLEKKIHSLTPEDRMNAKAIFEQAFKFYQSGDFPTARIRFEQGLDIDPSSAAANFYMAETLKHIGYVITARYYYQQTIKWAPDSNEAAQAHAALGS